MRPVAAPYRLIVVVFAAAAAAAASVSVAAVVATALVKKSLAESSKRAGPAAVEEGAQDRLLGSGKVEVAIAEPAVVGRESVTEHGILTPRPRGWLARSAE
jgi:hypothetical protein